MCLRSPIVFDNDLHRAFDWASKSRSWSCRRPHSTKLSLQYGEGGQLFRKYALAWLIYQRDYHIRSLEEPQGILVVLTHTHVMKHLFDVSRGGNFSLAETLENTNQVVGHIWSSQQFLIKRGSFAFSCCIEHNAHLPGFGRARLQGYAKDTNVL